MLRRLIDEPDARAEIDALLQPFFASMAVTPACISTKAALQLLGVLAEDTVRLPMVTADADERSTIRAALDALGLLGAEATA